MADTAPEPVPPSLPAPIVAVTPAQVWSAVVQNIAIAVCLTVAYFYGKLPQEYWLAGLGYLAGVDILGRKLAAKSPALAAALGATGGVGNIGRGALVVAFVTVAAGWASGCGVATELLPRTGEALLEMQRAQGEVIAARRAVERLVNLVCDQGPEPLAPVEVCDQAGEYLDTIHDATDSAADAIDAAAEVYRGLNEATK